MTNREIFNTYVVCGKLSDDLLDDKYNIDRVLDSDISIKSFIDVYLMYRENSKDIMMYFFRIGDMIIDSFYGDRKFCEDCIEDISKTYKLCIKHIGKFDLLSSIVKLYDNMWVECVGNRNLKGFKGKFRIMIACLIKFQGIDVSSGIILDNKRYSIVEYRSDYSDQRVFKLVGHKTKILSHIIIYDDSSIKFIGMSNNDIRNRKIKEMLRDNNVRLIITLDSVYDKWVKYDYERNN